MSAPPIRAGVFLDRDGTLIQEEDYLSDPERVRLLPGAAEAVSRLRAAGLPVVLVTNQSGIGRGLFTEAEYDAVHHRLMALLAAHGATLDLVKHCPHDPAAPGGPCPCRKPGTAMHRAAADELGLDLAGSCYIGDKVIDVLPALEVGGQGILVRTGYGRVEEDRIPPGIVVVDDLAEAAAWILGARR